MVNHDESWWIMVNLTVSYSFAFSGWLPLPKPSFLWWPGGQSTIVNAGPGYLCAHPESSFWGGRCEQVLSRFRTESLRPITQIKCSKVQDLKEMMPSAWEILRLNYLKIHTWMILSQSKGVVDVSGTGDCSRFPAGELFFYTGGSGSAIQAGPSCVRVHDISLYHCRLCEEQQRKLRCISVFRKPFNLQDYQIVLLSCWVLGMFGHLHWSFWTLQCQ